MIASDVSENWKAMKLFQSSVEAFIFDRRIDDEVDIDTQNICVGSCDYDVIVDERLHSFPSLNNRIFSKWRRKICDGKEREKERVLKKLLKSFSGNYLRRIS